MELDQQEVLAAWKNTCANLQEQVVLLETAVAMLQKKLAEGGEQE